MADLLSITTWRNAFSKHGSKLGWGLAIIFGLPLVVQFGLNQYGGALDERGAAEAAQNAPIARVNGEPITRKQFLQLTQRMQTQPGVSFAQMQGGALDQLISFTILKQEARKRRVRPGDAEVDRQITELRERTLGKKGTDADWERYLMQAFGASPREFREMVAEQMVGQALLNAFKAEEKVTEEDARKQSAEVKLAYVLVPVINPNSSMATPPRGPKPLPDAEAKKQAEALLAQARGGADIAALAKKHSADFSAEKGGDLGWQPEFTRFAFSLQGKEFAEAVRNTPTGQFTSVVRVKGFQPGYAFAKVVSRRNNLPKDFDAKKVIEQLKEERAQERLANLLREGKKQARIEILDLEKKAFHAFFRAQQMQQEQMMAQFGQGVEDAPTKEDVEKQQAEADALLEEALKKNPKDATLALMVAETLKRKRFDPKTSPQEREKINERLITLYETALESTENQEMRFELADMYRQKKQNDRAEKHYALIARLLAASPPYDVSTAQQANQAHRRLVAAFNSINKPEEAAKQQKLVAETEKKIAEYRAAEEKKRRELEQQQKATALTPPGGVTVAPGGTASVDQTVRTPAAKTSAASDRKPGAQSGSTP